MPAAYVIKLGIGQAANVAGILGALHSCLLSFHESGPFRTLWRLLLHSYSGAVFTVT
jgi:hypothetical protein